MSKKLCIEITGNGRYQKAVKKAKKQMKHRNASSEKRNIHAWAPSEDLGKFSLVCVKCGMKIPVREWKVPIWGCKD